MTLSQNDIKLIAKKLRSRCPDLAFEINALAAQAQGESVVSYVEVTHNDGSTRVMPASEYQRLTSTDLAHSKLRVLSQREASRLNG